MTHVTTLPSFPLPTLHQSRYQPLQGEDQMSRKSTLREQVDQLRKQRDWLIAAIRGQPIGTPYDDRVAYGVIREVERMRADASANLVEMRAYYADTHRQLLQWRAIRGEPCEKCNGSGQRMYGSTATWRGGIGGAAMTHAVCDQCWGSGDALCKWENLRILHEKLRALQSNSSLTLSKLS